ncbi:MAG: HlyD family efflux transporter periplasmic adaptor subunit [Clostridiales bacterium]|jgi:macrolide-specific efflux system membrane fusion protein|nr:HlyD family efflux transporter periplasmic adaptor subunit [Clostridiales bacterium]
MRTKHKKRRWIVWGAGLLIILGFVVFWGLRPKQLAYDEVQAKTGDVTTYYSFSGNVESKENQSVLADKILQISKIHVKEGDFVKKNDILLETTSGEQIKADIDGEVIALYVEENAPVAAGTPLLDVVNCDDLQVTVKVDEYDIKAVKKGNQVQVTIGALDNMEVSGTIAKVARQAVVVNGISYFTASVDLEQNTDLLVGMSAEVELLNQKVTDVVTLNVAALQFDEYNQPYVYYYDEKGNVNTKPVQVGVSDGTTAEITEGLQAGETVLAPKKSGMEAMMQGMRGTNGGKAE